ncbi:MAG: ATP-dependent Lon protease [Bradymonadia bacterium]|jgi:ATP-dependent Lon protease
MTKTLPFIALRTGTALPGHKLSLPIGRAQSLLVAKKVEVGDSIALVNQIDPRDTNPSLEQLQTIGVEARVARTFKLQEDRYKLVVEIIGRVTLRALAEHDGIIYAEVEELDETRSDTPQSRNLARDLIDVLAKRPGPDAKARDRIIADLRTQPPGRAVDMVTGLVPVPRELMEILLQTSDVVERLILLGDHLEAVETVQKVDQSIDRSVKQGLGKQQREAILRERLRAIQKELGSDEDGPAESMRAKLADIELPDDVQEVVDRELNRLERAPQQGAEHGVILKYLELIADLPWNERAEVTDDLAAVEERLDADHHGLDEVKERILEHLAVASATGNHRGAILCLVGPPGVGKTSLGRSIADATGRPFVRVALGGVRDEAEIRGHRRTYVGALPGRILNALRQAKVKNPIVMLDELDKLNTQWSGSPEAALLEVLDPEQNDSFTDHYLEAPFDLSEVFFIATANTLDTLSAPLRDRMEIIPLEGYTQREKVSIASTHLVPKLLAEHGFDPENVLFVGDALDTIIEKYTREAGVRQLSQRVRKIARSLTLQRARGELDEVITVDSDQVRAILGREKFRREAAEATRVPGVATGLAWTPLGGDILYIETSMMPGKGKVEITGKLGETMQESARAALTYLRTHADEFGVDPRFLEENDLHVHVPAGGVPKDGPSAGVTMFTALTSLLTGRSVRADTAMTGEATLRGRVLPVGGIKSKVLAAHRAGLTRVILPEGNRADIEDVPESVREEMEFIFATQMSDAINAALVDSTWTPDGAGKEDELAA